MELDRRLEVIGVSETAGGLLDSLDGGVDGFETGVGEPVVEVGQDVGQMALDQLVHLGHGLQPAVSGPQN